MATARCYTKSGSVEKYESNLWKSPTTGNWSSFGVLGTITTPDSNGNYTVTPANNFEDSNAQTEFYCYTMYGSVRKTFYFKEKDITITIKISIRSIGKNSGGNIVFDCNVLTNDSDRYGIVNHILANNSIILSYTVVNTDGIVGIYRTRVTSDMTLLNPGIRYVFGKSYYVRGGAYTNPSSGTLIYSSKKYNWNTSVFVGT